MVVKPLALRGRYDCVNKDLIAEALKNLKGWKKNYAYFKFDNHGYIVHCINTDIPQKAHDTERGFVDQFERSVNNEKYYCKIYKVFYNADQPKPVHSGPVETPVQVMQLDIDQQQFNKYVQEGIFLPYCAPVTPPNPKEYQPLGSYANPQYVKPKAGFVGGPAPQCTLYLKIR